MEEERVRQLEQEESDRLAFYAAVEAECEREHQIQVDAEKAEATRRRMELEAKRLREQLEDRELRQEQHRRSRELHEQESLQAALDKSRREEERREELHQESMREEARRAAVFEEAGRLAQQKLLEEANRLEAERIAEEARLAEQRELASRRLNTEVVPNNSGSQADQIVGKRISLLMNNSRLRYMGTVLLVTMDSILLQSVTSHGTEGRFLALASPQPGKDVAAEFGVVHSQMRFVKTDIKDLHVHEPAADVAASPASLSKHEIEIAEL